MSVNVPILKVGKPEHKAFPIRLAAPGHLAGSQPRHRLPSENDTPAWPPAQPQGGVGGCAKVRGRGPASGPDTAPTNSGGRVSEKLPQTVHPIIQIPASPLAVKIGQDWTFIS